MSKRLYIERLGHRGEGVARIGEKTVFVPYALAGETVRAEIEGDQARLIEIIDPSPDRVAPICPHYTKCGGCAVQTLPPAASAGWKRDLVARALKNAGLSLEVGRLVDAHGAGRRRVTFHARMIKGKARVGFMAARSHEIVEIDACPLLAPQLAGALPVARDLAQALAGRGKPLDIVIAATLNGMDVDLRGAGPFETSETSFLIAVAERHELARLSNHGRIVVLRRPPEIAIGAARVALPPGAFLQATQAGEDALAAHVMQAAQGAKRAADLFCGAGAFALRLAQTAGVAAFDNDEESVAALLAAAASTSDLRKVEGGARDLFERPLSAAELIRFDAVVFDPPRAGAAAQAAEIAKSGVKTVVAVSCNAQSFARDAAILIAGGYEARRVTPVDQFRFSAHVEIVSEFVRRDSLRVKKPFLLR
jgi:23S rRNA (uracil1939-C5)-methyltransferase